MVSPVSSSVVTVNLAPLNNDLGLEELIKRKSELLDVKEKIEKLLSDINAREEQLKNQVAPEKPIPVLTIQITPTETSQKATEVTHSTLVIHTNEIMTSDDDTGERKHYPVSLTSKNNETIKVDKFPVDVEKYGPIEKIVLSNGESKIALNDKDTVQRLIKYFSTEFGVFRKGINKVGRDGYYSNEYNAKFECQRFSYYLNYGEEDIYFSIPHIFTSEYRQPKVKHIPYACYCIKAQKDDLGKQGKYGTTNMSVHHYMCLAEDVFISKFGRADVLFTSYQQILDAYFPSEFTTGVLYRT
jgi:hypothetical protein